MTEIIDNLDPLSTACCLSEATYFQTRSMQDCDPETVVLKGIGDTQIYVARL